MAIRASNQAKQHYTFTQLIHALPKLPPYGPGQGPPACDCRTVIGIRNKGAAQQPAPPFQNLEIRPPVAQVCNCVPSKPYPKPTFVWAGSKGRQMIVKDLPIGGGIGGFGGGTGGVGIGGVGGTASGVGVGGSSAAVTTGRKVGPSTAPASAIATHKTVLQLSLGSPTMPGGIVPYRKVKS
jgi:hypothetical protein